VKQILIILLLVALLFSSAVSAQVNTPSSNNSTMNQFKNLQSLHDSTKALSVQLLFKGTDGTTRSLQLKKDGLLPEHTTPNQALLVCVSGEVLYEDETKQQHLLKAGDIFFIQPNVKHWLKGLRDSQLLLMK
jgi:quercetin dioxygenase-like cupin family protein